MRLSRLMWLILPTLVAGALLGACSPIGPAWVDEDASYTIEEARALLDRVDIDELTDTSVDDATKLREAALAGLRNRGDEASDAATLITSVFPTDVKAVPVYVERATVDGVEALIVIEAWGARDGTLSLERSWVLDTQTGDVIDSAAGR